MDFSRNWERSRGYFFRKWWSRTGPVSGTRRLGLVSRNWERSKGHFSRNWWNVFLYLNWERGHFSKWGRELRGLVVCRRDGERRRCHSSRILFWMGTVLYLSRLYELPVDPAVPVPTRD